MIYFTFLSILTVKQGSFFWLVVFLFWLLELKIPFSNRPYSKLNHARVNITFTLITLILNLFGAFGILKAVDFVSTNNFGLLNMIVIPLWMYVLIGLDVNGFYRSLAYSLDPT